MSTRKRARNRMRVARLKEMKTQRKAERRRGGERYKSYLDWANKMSLVARMVALDMSVAIRHLARQLGDSEIKL